MKSVIISITLLLSACTSVVPVTTKWPDAPVVIVQEPCPNLQNLSDNPKLSEVAKIVANNYSEYYQCAAKLSAWQRWYIEQQVIHKGLK
jgi:hypothetical protein